MGGRGQMTQTYPEANEDKIDRLGQQWANNLEQNEMNSVYDYTGVAYHKINKYLRSGKVPDGGIKEELDAYVNNIESSLKGFDLPRNITVYRGAKGKSMFGVELGNWSAEQINDAFKGSIVQDNGFGSASIDKDRSFDKQVKYEIRVPKGKGRGAYVAPISDVPGEKEFLIQRGSYYKIDGARKENGQTVITMTWIPASRVPKM